MALGLGLGLNLGARGGGISTPATPVIPSMYKAILDGDSLSSSQIWAVTSINIERRAAGYWTVFAALSYQMFSTRYAQSYGASGHTIDQIESGIATPIAYVEANSVNAVFLQLGANDVTSVTSLATIKASYTNVITSYVNCANNPYVFVGLPTPRANFEAATEPERAGYITRLYQIRADLTEIVGTLGAKCILVDAWSDIVDPAVINPTTGLTYYPKSGFMASDGIHLIHKGAHALAKRYLNAVKTTSLWGAPVALPSTSGAYNPNPSLTGTSGAKGTGVTGEVADSCQVVRGAGSAITAVCSKETTTIFGISQMTQKIVLSGATTGVEEMYFHAQYPTGTPTYDGTKGIEFIVPIKVSSPVGLQGVYLYNRATVSGTTYTGKDMTWTSGNMFPDNDGTIEYLLRTEPLLLPAGTATVHNLLVRMPIDATVGGNGATIWIGQPVARLIAP